MPTVLIINISDNCGAVLTNMLMNSLCRTWFFAYGQSCC